MPPLSIQAKFPGRSWPWRSPDLDPFGLPPLSEQIFGQQPYGFHPGPERRATGGVIYAGIGSVIGKGLKWLRGLFGFGAKKAVKKTAKGTGLSLTKGVSKVLSKAVEPPVKNIPLPPPGRPDWVSAASGEPGTVAYLKQAYENIWLQSDDPFGMMEQSTVTIAGKEMDTFHAMMDAMVSHDFVKSRGGWGGTGSGAYKGSARDIEIELLDHLSGMGFAEKDVLDFYNMMQKGGRGRVLGSSLEQHRILKATMKTKRSRPVPRSLKGMGDYEEEALAEFLKRYGLHSFDAPKEMQNLGPVWPEKGIGGDKATELKAIRDRVKARQKDPQLPPLQYMPGFRINLKTGEPYKVRVTPLAQELIDARYRKTGLLPNDPVEPSIWEDLPPKLSFHDGGLVPRQRGGDVPAYLQSGEFVMQKKAVDNIGLSNLERMNSGGVVYAKNGRRLPRLHAKGQLPPEQSKERAAAIKAHSDPHRAFTQGEQDPRGVRGQGFWGGLVFPAFELASESSLDVVGGIKEKLGWPKGEQERLREDPALWEELLFDFTHLIGAGVVTVPFKLGKAGVSAFKASPKVIKAFVAFMKNAPISKTKEGLKEAASYLAAQRKTYKAGKKAMGWQGRPFRHKGAGRGSRTVQGPPVPGVDGPRATGVFGGFYDAMAIGRRVLAEGADKMGPAGMAHGAKVMTLQGAKAWDDAAQETLKRAEVWSKQLSGGQRNRGNKVFDEMIQSFIGEAKQKGDLDILKTLDEMFMTSDPAQAASVQNLHRMAIRGIEQGRGAEYYGDIETAFWNDWAFDLANSMGDFDKRLGIRAENILNDIVIDPQMQREKSYGWASRNTDYLRRTGEFSGRGALGHIQADLPELMDTTRKMKTVGLHRQNMTVPGGRGRRAMEAEDIMFRGMIPGGLSSSTPKDFEEARAMLVSLRRTAMEETLHSIDRSGRIGQILGRAREGHPLGVGRESISATFDKDMGALSELTKPGTAGKVPEGPFAEIAALVDDEAALKISQWEMRLHKATGFARNFGTDTISHAEYIAGSAREKFAKLISAYESLIVGTGADTVAADKLIEEILGKGKAQKFRNLWLGTGSGIGDIGKPGLKDFLQRVDKAGRFKPGVMANLDELPAPLLESRFEDISRINFGADPDDLSPSINYDSPNLDWAFRKNETVDLLGTPFYGSGSSRSQYFDPQFHRGQLTLEQQKLFGELPGVDWRLRGVEQKTAQTGFHQGGLVTGLAGGGDVIARLQQNEYVLRSNAASRLTRDFGPDFLNNMNNYHSGGHVGSQPSSTSISGGGGGGEISVNMTDFTNALNATLQTFTQGMQQIVVPLAEAGNNLSKVDGSVITMNSKQDVNVSIPNHSKGMGDAMESLANEAVRSGLNQVLTKQGAAPRPANKSSVTPIGKRQGLT